MYKIFALLMAILCCTCVTARAQEALREIDLDNPSVTQGQPAFQLTDPDRAIFSFLNPGMAEVTGTLSLNLIEPPSGVYQVTWNVFSLESLALAGGSGDLFSGVLMLDVAGTFISTGNGESLNYLSNFSFLYGGGGSTNLWASMSLNAGALGLANVADPLGQPNYLVQGGMAFNLNDIGFPNRSFAVSLNTVPSPGPMALAAFGGLRASRRRR